MVWGAWQAIVQRITQLDTTEYTHTVNILQKPESIFIQCRVSAMSGISRFRWVILKIILNVMMKSYTALPGLTFPSIWLGIGIRSDFTVWQEKSGYCRGINKYLNETESHFILWSQWHWAQGIVYSPCFQFHLWWTWHGERTTLRVKR